jgi:hypothetical protein
LPPQHSKHSLHDDFLSDTSEGISFACKEHRLFRRM